MTQRYAVGWTDANAVYSTGWGSIRYIRYGEEFKKMDYTKALASSLQQTRMKIINDMFGKVFSVWNKQYQGAKDMKTDAHKYETEAKDLDIEVAKDFWIVKYGNEKVSSEELANQDPFTWECGNRLYWAGYLQRNEAPDILNEFYTLADKPCKS